MRVMRIRTAFLALWLSALACASPPPPAEPVPAPSPALKLGPGGSEPLAFMHVVTRIPAGTLLGIAHWEGSKEIAAGTNNGAFFVR